MRIRAFTLIEIIVVIILLGTIFSLVLSNYKSKKISDTLSSIKDIPSYMSKIYAASTTKLIIYGKNCDKSVVEVGADSYRSAPLFGFKKEDKVLVPNNMQQFRTPNFDNLRIKKKIEDVCFILNFNKGRFTDKFILVSKTRFYLFLPFYQAIKEFNSLQNAKDAYIGEKLYPSNRDDYYDE